MIAMGLALVALSTCAALAHRRALWEVVRACMADYDLTGQPFPCLAVEPNGGGERGWVVLRPPVGTPDTILAPTRKIVGIEDPWLQSGEAPNYFQAAWKARALVKTADGRALTREETALAVNSRFVRSQDQLHIHIGCLKPGVRRALSARAPQLTAKEWTPLGPLVWGADIRALRVEGVDLAGLNPFRAAAGAFALDRSDPTDLLIVVAALDAAADSGEFVILAAQAAAKASRHPPAADEIIDPACDDAN
jgi:CDP-diacylglycerol pyrophosphatase